MDTYALDAIVRAIDDGDDSAIHAWADMLEEEQDNLSGFIRIVGPPLFVPVRVWTLIWSGWAWLNDEYPAPSTAVFSRVILPTYGHIHGITTIRLYLDSERKTRVVGKIFPSRSNAYLALAEAMQKEQRSCKKGQESESDQTTRS